MMAIIGYIFRSGIPLKLVRSSVCKFVGGPLAECWDTHGLRDRLGGRSFKPRALFVFFWKGVGFGAMASPSSVCLGCRSVCSGSCFLFLSLLACLVLLFWLFSLFCLCFFVGALRLLPFVLSCSCFLLVLMSWGGLFCGWLCTLRCLCLLFCFALPQRKPARVLPCAMHACFFVSSCFLSHIVFWLCLFVFDARARAATASPRIRFHFFLRRSLAVSRPPTYWPSCSPLVWLLFKNSLVSPSPL